MPGSIISIINQKGGVGKTTSALNIAAGYAREGFRTLLIDLDPQMNCSSILLRNGDLGHINTSYDLFFADLSLMEIIAPAKDLENLYFVPSSVKLTTIETLLAGNVEGFFRLMDKFSDSNFDILVLDCPPSLSLITINALVASTGVIIPVQISKFSIDGIQGIIDTVESIKKRYNKNLRILGALVTFYNNRTSISQAILPIISQYLPVFDTKVSQSIAVEESHLLKMTLFEYKKTCKPAIEYGNLVKELIDVFKIGKI